MSNFSNVTRRKFLFAAGVSAAGPVLLKGCVGSLPLATAPIVDILSDTSHSIKIFFDSVKFDPANSEAYLSSLQIKWT